MVPGGAGEKPWWNHSLSNSSVPTLCLCLRDRSEGRVLTGMSCVVAMPGIALAQETWYETWPKNIADHAMVIDSVKMWQRS